MTKTFWIVVAAGIVSACQATAVDQGGDRCDSVPPVTKRMIDGMEQEGAVAFVDKNHTLMNLEIVWLQGDTPASCTRMYVTEINSIENEDSGKVKVGYYRGASDIWHFSPDKNYGNGRIRNGTLSVTWPYGTARVTRNDEGDLEALWRGEPYSLVPGKKRGRVNILEPLDYK